MCAPHLPASADIRAARSCLRQVRHEGVPCRSGSRAARRGWAADAADGVRVGGFFNLFHERDSSFHDRGLDESWWVERPGAPMTPKTVQGTVGDGDFKTALFDVKQSKQSVKWGTPCSSAQARALAGSRSHTAASRAPGAAAIERQWCPATRPQPIRAMVMSWVIFMPEFRRSCPCLR